MNIKELVQAAHDQLQELYQSGYIREEGNVKFQSAMNSLDQALASPDPAPVTVDSPDLVQLNATMADVDTKLENMGVTLADIQTKVTPAPAV